MYLKVEELEPGQENGLGRRFRLHTKALLPYTLDWESCAIESRPPNRLAIRATSDLNGRGIWTIRQKGNFTEVEFDWKLTAEKPLMRYLSFFLKPVFSANHRWAMRRGLERHGDGITTSPWLYSSVRRASQSLSKTQAGSFKVVR